MSHQSDSADIETATRGTRAFPPELLQFFTQRQGRVLLVLGDPGAGKTLLAVRSLDVLRQYSGDVLYVSTRVDTDTIYRNYLAEQTDLTRSNVLDISQDPFESDITPAEDIGTDRFDPEAFLKWLQAIGTVSDRFTLAFDSWELVQRYLLSHARGNDPIEPGRLVTRIASLARQHDLRILLVTEQPDQTELDYVVDGVVELYVAHSAGGRPERQLRFEKLRGVRIGNRTQPFTLSEETFRVFTSDDLPLAQRTSTDAEWQAVANTKATFSTGIADLDTMLGGGYSRGSVVHFELGPDLSRDAWSLPCLATARNFLSHGMGVVVVPLPESSPGLVRHNLEPICSDGTFDTHCEVFETYDHERMVETAVPDESGVDGEAGADTAAESVHGFQYAEYLDRIESLREESDGPLLHVISMDAAGDVFAEVTSDHATYVALHNDLSILVTKPGGGERARADRVADVHLRLERRGETVFLYGKNPVTPFLGVDTGANDDISNITLQEMV